MDRKFPRIVIDRDKLRNNCTQIVKHCEARGIAVAGVIKGAGGLPEIARLYRSCGAAQLATSRLEQMELWRREGIPGPYMLLRVPGLSELPEVARLADYSLQSDATTLDALNSVCAEQGVTHRVIVMADLGDLREGFWDKTEMVEVCCHVEQGLDHLHLAGVGVNLGCYGAVKPTPENMGQLVDIARAVEARIGRRLEIVSGGATSSYTLVHWGTMPQGINHLRIGEFALLGGIYGCYPDFLRRDVFTLRMEVVECKPKPSYPVGELTVDAFGKTREYTDRGIRRRALCAAGRVDYGDPFDLTPRLAGVEVLGASSDHTILDVEDAAVPVRLGDVLDFGVSYGSLVYLTNTPEVRIVYRKGGRLYTAE